MTDVFRLNTKRSMMMMMMMEDSYGFRWVMIHLHDPALIEYFRQLVILEADVIAASLVKLLLEASYAILPMKKFE